MKPTANPCPRLRATAATLGALAALTLPSVSFAQTQPNPASRETASFAVETVLSLSTDRRTRGISDSMHGPSAELSVTLAHESGLVGLVQLNTVSKRLFPQGNGLGVTLGGGYRWGDPEGWHYGAGLAAEYFPGAKVSAPTALDPATFAPVDFESTNFNSSFALLELGWNMVEMRYLHVLSKDYRGANTGTVCGTLIQQPDPTAGIDCYLRGKLHSRGSQLLDLDIKLPVADQTKLLLHWGLQRVANFKQANTQDWRVGLTHTRWGLDLTAEAVGAKTRERALFVGVRGDGSTRQLDTTAVVLTVAKKF